MYVVMPVTWTYSVQLKEGYLQNGYKHDGYIKSGTILTIHNISENQHGHNYWYNMAHKFIILIVIILVGVTQCRLSIFVYSYHNLVKRNDFPNIIHPPPQTFAYMPEK